MDNPFTSSAVESPTALDVQRRMEMAKMLMQQGLSPDGGTQYAPGGVAIRKSPLEGLAKMLQVYMGRQNQDQADTMQRQIQQQGTADAMRFADALRAKPAAPTGDSFQTGANEMGDEAAIVPQWQGPQAPDSNKAMAIALGSQNPMLQQLGGSLLGGMLPKPDKWGTDPRYDQNGNAYLVSEQGNVKPLSGVKARDKVEVTNGQAYNPYATAPGTTFAPQANPYENLAVPGPDGSIIPNQPIIEAKKAIAKSGAANTSIKIDNKTGESLAAQVGPMIAQSHTAALGAQGAIVNADNITKALDSGKVIAGPGATLRLRGEQIANAFGVGGKDTAEKITKTREVIQGLAQSTLTARKQLAGQGQVSDNEGKLLERAASGNIDDMTMSEIRTVVGVNKRLAERQIQLHNQLIDKTKANPATAPIANFFELPAQQQPQGGGTMRFDSQGNPVP